MSLRNFSATVICLVLCSTFLTKAQGAMLTYSFDDGHISVYSKAFPILSAYGQVGTANVISNTVKWADSGETSRVNSTQLREMQNAGWEICSHSKSHPRFSQIPQTFSDELLYDWKPVPGSNYTYKSSFAYQQLPFLMQDGNYLNRKASIEEVDGHAGSYYYDNTSQSVYVHTKNSDSPSSHEIRADSVERELAMSKEELTGTGLNISSFVVPYSDWNKEREQLAMQYYDSVGVGYNSGWFNTIPPDDPYWLARRPIVNTTTVEEVQGWISEAIAEDKWLILMLHVIGDDEYKYSWSQENLEAIAAWVDTQDILVVTQQRGMELTAVPIPYSSVLLLSGFVIIIVFRFVKVFTNSLCVNVSETPTPC